MPVFTSCSGQHAHCCQPAAAGPTSQWLCSHLLNSPGLSGIAKIMLCSFHCRRSSMPNSCRTHVQTSQYASKRHLAIRSQLNSQAATCWIRSLCYPHTRARCASSNHHCSWHKQELLPDSWHVHTSACCRQCGCCCSTASSLCVSP